MSKISGRETKPEIIVRKFLFAHGFRYLKNDKRYPGTPDIVLPKYNTIIFVHGCFWHGHNCKAGKLPNTRRDFWKKKISNTVERDQKHKTELIEKGWSVITVWGCNIKSKADRDRYLPNIIDEIVS